MSYDTTDRSECSEFNEMSHNSLKSEVCEVFFFDDNESLGRTPSLEYYYDPSINLGDIRFTTECEDIVINLAEKTCHCKGCRCHIVPIQGHCHRCNCYQESGIEHFSS